MKIGVYVAHEDDAILGVGGIIIQHLEKGDDVYIVVCTDGRNSHKLGLNIENHPTPLEVMETRKREMANAMKILGIKKIYFLDIEDGAMKNNLEVASRKISEISRAEKPDIVYFHHYDAHPDHKAVSKIVTEIFNSFDKKPEMYQFFIWDKELAKGRREVDIDDAPEIPKKSIRVDIRNVLEKKRKSLYEMRSQILLHPYPNWQVQKKPILNKDFVDYFLRGEEIFIKL